ncbi:MAG: ABC transporter substrate-binding protein [Casimicrobiaceae bacterium]
MPLCIVRFALLLFAASNFAAAQVPQRLVFSTDWFAEAEHGGFYQAQAEGIYQKYGLDVVLQMGGPQVNGLQLAAAGRIDIAMGDALQVLAAREQHVPLVAIAATFQKNPTVIIAHPGVATLAALKGKPVAVGAASNTTFWPWLKTRYGFDDAQKRPYGFSVQPFLADPALSQQGFATSEPYTIEKAGITPKVFLLADLGYPPYSEVLIVSEATLAKRADALRRFVEASAEGWRRYLKDPTAGNALIRKANPQMTAELLAYGYRKIKEYQLVDGGDAAQHGLLSMTDARWQLTLAFMRDAGIARPGIDYTAAWTTALSRDTHARR